MRRSIISLLLLFIPFLLMFFYYILAKYCFSAGIQEDFDIDYIIFVPSNVPDLYDHRLLKYFNSEFDLLYSYFGCQRTAYEPCYAAGITKDMLCSWNNWEYHETILLYSFFYFYNITIILYLLVFLFEKTFVKKSILLYPLCLFIFYSIVSYKIEPDTSYDFYVLEYTFHILFCLLLGMINGIITWIVYNTPVLIKSMGQFRFRKFQSP